MDERLLQLELWREACRHLEIGEFLKRAFPLLARHFPLTTLLVRRVDPTAGKIETVALAGAAPSPPLSARHECPPTEMKRLLAWSAAGQVTTLDPQLSALFSRSDPAWLAGPLHTEQGWQGAMLVRTATVWTTQHRRQFQDLLEPFAVALDHDRRLRELRTLREALEADKRALLSKLGRHDISDSVVGAEAGLKGVMQQAERVAVSDVPVLILGETGSGKEVVARAIHSRSRRASGPFLRVNCGAIPPELVDSELFGHERGSFTGAVGTRAGWFERADGGTLFLDECGELPLAAQVRLLRILQDGLFERVGGEKPLQVDVRIVAATHRDLRAMSAAGQFRPDLWYRLAVFPIRLPALRERPEDIPALAAHFALRSAQRLGLSPLLPTSDDIALLVAYPWPGNVRELSAVIERAALLGDGRKLEIAAALGTAPPPAATAALPWPASFSPTTHLTLDEAMARHIETALVHTEGQIEGRHGAAALLQINPHTLRARMRKLGIDWQRFRPAVEEQMDLPLTRQKRSA